LDTFQEQGLLFLTREGLPCLYLTVGNIQPLC
jgi:hypothetical protein